MVRDYAYKNAMLLGYMVALYDEPRYWLFYAHALGDVSVSMGSRGRGRRSWWQYLKRLVRRAIATIAR